MKLARRLILWLIVGVCAVLGVFAYIRVERELSLFDADIRRDHRAVALTVKSALESTAKTAGPEQARSLLDDIDDSKSDLKLRLVSANERLGAPLGALERQALDADETVHGTANPGGDERLYTFVGVRLGGERSVIELSESLAPSRAYLRTTLTNLTLSMILVVAVSAAVLLGLGLTLLGRPMAALANKARRVGEGDLSGPLELPQRDEIGELAAEMNAMCDRLAKARTDLEDETARRIATLEQLRHADRLTTVGRLAAGIAHELGTPLNVVSGRAKMIARSRTTQEQTEEYARIIAEQSDRMAGIIRQLLDFARRGEPKRSDAELVRLAGETQSLLKPLAEKRKVDVVVADQGPVTAFVDSSQLQQVLTNLVVNAIHASNEGGRVEIEVARTRRAPPDGKPMQVALLRVCDRGHGMTAAVLEQAFEPFFTTKNVGDGTGLGLSVTRDIVREHGGWIEIESEPERGTDVSVYLPIDD